MKKILLLYLIVTLSSTIPLLGQIDIPKEVLQQQLEELSQEKITRPAYVQIDQATALEIFDRAPSFGMFHDNYFITGIPLDRRINRYTADVKYQISIRQRVTKSILPFNTFLFLTYTQKSFWDIYAKSSPFMDNNYNPGVSIGKAMIDSRDQLKGIVVLSLEHESNGKDSISSRSWNYISASWLYFFNPRISMQFRGWYGFVDKVNNPNLMRYKGYGIFVLNYWDRKERFGATLIVNPRQGFSRFNTTVEVNFKPRPKFNQYLFLQMYDGYAENLLHYNEYRCMLRFGFCIKPTTRSYY